MDIDVARMAWLGVPLVAMGLGIALLATCWLVVSERHREQSCAPEKVEPPRAGQPLDRAWLAALIVVVAVGAAVRLTGLDAKGLSHTEVYVPGLDLPADISEPPPRHRLVETAVWHFLYEPHPFGYYLAMWLWTQSFGASLLSIRMPEALWGLLSVYLIYRVGRSVYGSRVGVIAAALLALHGFHIYWSQTARMYAPGAGLGVLSTGLLLEMTRRSRPRPWCEAAYVVTTVAGTMTVELFWPFLAAQTLWVALRERDVPWRPPRAAVIQTLAALLAAPTLSHSVMLARHGAAPPPSLGFLAHYFSFGFLFRHGAYDGGEVELPLVASGAVLLLGLVLAGHGMRCAARADESDGEVPNPISSWPLAVAAVGSATMMLGMAFVAEQRTDTLMVMSLLPLVALLVPRAAGRVGPAVGRLSPRLAHVVAHGGHPAALVALLAVGPTLALFVVSFALTLTAPRAFLQFVPYLLLMTAAGVWQLRHRRAVAGGLAVVLSLAFGGSAVVLRHAPTSARDYQGLARLLTPSMQPGDLVFAPRAQWAFTPMFLYVDHDRLVATDYAEAVRRRPDSRVWVLAIPPEAPPSEAVARALSGHLAADRVEARGIAARLYRPDPTSLRATP